jgi:hypothetical protein
MRVEVRTVTVSIATRIYRAAGGEAKIHPAIFLVA